MKRILSYITICMLAAAFAGCTKDKGSDTPGDGRGCLLFAMKFNGEVATRADAPENVTVKIANSEGVIYKYESLGEVPSRLWLVADYYTVTVEGGSKVAYGWDTPYYKGSEAFVITGGESTSVTVECLIQNTLFTVGFEESVDTHLTDSSVTLYPDPDNASNTLIFDETTTEAVACVILERGQTSIDWEFNATRKEGGTVHKEGALDNLQARKKYILTFKYTPSEATGEFGLDVTVDETTVDRGHDISIYQRPQISATGFDITQIQSPADSYRIVASAKADIASIVLSGSLFDSGYDLLDSANDPSGYGVDVDVMAGNKIGVTFTAALFGLMPDGINAVAIAVADRQERTNSAVFSVEIADGDNSAANAVDRTHVWATFADVTGVVDGEGRTVRFAYRPSAGGEWEYASASEENGGYGARITGISGGTEYRVRIEVDGVLRGQSVTFATEEATALPNGDFEQWWKSGNTWYPYLQNGTKFWDSANGGLGLASGGEENKNPTMSSSDVRPGSPGVQSTKMNSRYLTVMIISKFAAGNIFTGKFAGISITPQGGKVDFGQPFTSRPSALKGWYKGNAGTVTHAEGNSPIGEGDPDEYMMYVCLTDWTEQHRLNTWAPDTYIDFDDPSIIAYGYKAGTGSVPNWTDFEIPLKYKSTDRIPTMILVVATSSRYGDYLTGSTDSWLQVDDFELVYNELTEEQIIN